jgi:hypothetical protein
VEGNGAEAAERGGALLLWLGQRAVSRRRGRPPLLRRGAFAGEVGTGRYTGDARTVTAPLRVDDGQGSRGWPG